MNMGVMMKRKVIVGNVVAAIAVLASGGGYAAWYKSDAETAKRLVKDRLVDPDSAKFYDLESCPDGNGGEFIIGQVNSRNSAGGMTGKKTFIAEGFRIAPYVMIESGHTAFTNIADKYNDARVAAPMRTSCTEIYQIANKNRGESDPAMETYSGLSLDMNATEGMDTISQNMAEVDRLLGTP